MNFRRLKENEIELRIGNVGAKGYTLLLYKNARADMNILDETVGEENWQRKHYECKGNLFCSVGIRIDNNWIWKDDCGAESNTEKEKGEASDSFKRACVNWGIGRELYTSPFIFIKAPTEKTEYGYKITDINEKYRKFKVTHIEYNTDREIVDLEIIDNNGVVVFSMKTPERKKLDQDLVKELIGLGGTLEIASAYYKVDIEDLTDEHIEKLIEARRKNMEKSNGNN